jgi:leucyl aminopeptidase
MSLKITVSGADPLALSVDAVAIGVAKGVKKTGALKTLISKLGTVVSKAIRRSEFKGKKGQICEVPTGGKLKPGTVYLIGLGDLDELGTSCLRRLAAMAARRAGNSRNTSLGFELPDIEGAERYAAEGAVLGAYRYEQFRTDAYKVKYPLTKVSLLTKKKVNSDIRDAAALGQRVGEAVCHARDLINMPPNELYPETLAAYAKQVAKDNKADGLTCTVFGHKWIKDKGMNLLDAVGKGSRRGPRVIHMKYTPKGGAKDKRRLVFVGKGLTFDTGGICLKPAPGMEEMKGDMGGAANVVALMAAVAATQPDAEIHGIIASAENMPDGDAYRPGDVFKAYNGKYVEIINTDAEGRLALADVLHYATELEPDFILDNATLTGACVVALGPTVSGYFSNDDGLAERIGDAAKRAGESMWHLPLVEELRDKLKSDWADFKHMGDRWGGCITAALFLREFIGDYPWIHVDIAGPSMADKSYDMYSKGGTGAGVLTYLELIDDLIANGV